MGTSNPAPGFPPGGPAIIPVIDIMGGRVVRAVGGRRGEYRPIRSVLTDSTEPAEVAKALVAATGAVCVYLADLDAIMHGRPDLESVRAVADLGVPVLCDGGFRTLADPSAQTRCNTRCVVGTETGSLSLVSAISQWRCGVSLDLRDGWVVGDRASWGGTLDPLEVAFRAFDAGAETLIVLDLTRVGTGSGPGTERLIAELKRSIPQVDLLAGGGVRTWADVDRLGEAGADAVLVASALHDGTITLPRPAS